MRVLVTGARGQLGRELQRSCPEDVELAPFDLEQLDITRDAQIRRVIESVRPDLIINAAAYTAVDRAEQESALAFAVNAEGPRKLAHAAAQADIRLIHISTDFVFSGGQDRPYGPDSKPDPQSVYGESKLAGEEYVLKTDSGLVVRTAWVYSRFGTNFVKTMLRLMSERDEISVVMDQTGTPTWARSLTRFLWACRKRTDLHGVYHWTDLGEATWFEFAMAIQGEATRLRLLDSTCRILPVTTADFPTLARRPAYSVLDITQACETLKLEGLPWRDQLQAMLRDMQDHGED